MKKSALIWEVKILEKARREMRQGGGETRWFSGHCLLGSLEETSRWPCRGICRAGRAAGGWSWPGCEMWLPGPVPRPAVWQFINISIWREETETSCVSVSLAAQQLPSGRAPAFPGKQLGGPEQWEMWVWVGLVGRGSGWSRASGWGPGGGDAEGIWGGF